MEPIRSEADVSEGLAALLRQCPELEPAAGIAGPLPLRLQKPGFAGLARIVIGQQVSRASAAAIHRRFSEMILPQTAEAFLDAGEAVWIAIGLSRAKQRTLARVAEAVCCGELDFEGFARLDAGDSMAILTGYPGIGPWTAEVYLLFCAGHPDIFPAGDLALQEGAARILGLATRPDEKTLRKAAEKWSPYRGIAARLVWAYYSSVKDNRETAPI